MVLPSAQSTAIPFTAVASQSTALKTWGVENREMQQVTRMAQWTEQAKAWLLYAFYYARRENCEAPVYLVYESRPFMMAKHRKGIQSAPAVMSYAESLCMLRSVLAQVVATPCAKPEPLMGAILPKWWQGNLISNVMVFPKSSWKKLGVIT
jgi:hypothetical protein